jgi:vacuolar-type H+-ATPase subunit H
MTTLLIIVIIILIILMVSNRNRFRETVSYLTSNLNSKEKEKSELINRLDLKEKENANLTDTILNLEQRNSELSIYSGLVDIEQKANEIINKADQIQESAQNELLQAIADADKIREQATSEISISKKEALNKLNNATIEARKIIENAQSKAIQIGGDAYKSLQNSEEFRKTAIAMKNIIEGYGDEYLIPTYSLLDDLAEEFNHTDAGEMLQLARERSRMMIKNATAAKCDYVETNRKETAVTFVLDAFNGKVDSILSKVKKDNYGILEQKIKDSFQVVNNNGKAFRNAVIMQGYLEVRIEELKWAAIVQELKWEEQEEQRRIKEQIREEEKARRDYEKAIRETEKEEELLKKLIEKAQKEVELASADQKSKYEETVADLEQKLKIAEEKNQRALSMAQQTKSGNVYIISNIGSFGENVYKIGMTRRLEPLDRVRELGGASVPFEFDVHSMIYSENAPALERDLHKKFIRLQMNKVNPRKEFFKISLTEIKEELEKMSINVKWTMKAEARRYRESLVIEKAIFNDQQKQLEWEKHQEQSLSTVDNDEETEDLSINEQ